MLEKPHPCQSSERVADDVVACDWDTHSQSEGAFESVWHPTALAGQGLCTHLEAWTSSIEYFGNARDVQTRC